MLEVRGLHKSFGTKNVLNGIDLDVDSGGVTALIGPSGSGKTTLLRSLNALEIPEKGTVTINGAQVDYGAQPTSKELRQLRAQSGMVFQAHHLFPHLTALDNVILGPIRSGKISRTEAEAEGRSLLAEVGLAGLEDRLPRQLSGGQQQRVGIARALALKPQLLLFDEPTSALDPETVGEVLVVMRRLAREGWTMVVVTHEIAFARAVADQVLFLDGGEVVERGAASKVLTSPTQPRTAQFLRRILDPLADAGETTTISRPE
ncbi:amino acid ABC transporter ATP-binding protein [Arcanobacterium haemolyticum]|nr:amino acid ABC transporter ATP-binding protein [Arcanobacterium haemolyticum]